MTAKRFKNWIRVREGVRYMIHVEETDADTMWGTCNCHECDVGGSSAKRAATIYGKPLTQRKVTGKGTTRNHRV